MKTNQEIREKAVERLLNRVKQLDLYTNTCCETGTFAIYCFESEGQMRQLMKEFPFLVPGLYYENQAIGSFVIAKLHCELGKTIEEMLAETGKDYRLKVYYPGFHNKGAYRDELPEDVVSLLDKWMYVITNDTDEVVIAFPDYRPVVFTYHGHLNNHAIGYCLALL